MSCFKSLLFSLFFLVSSALFSQDFSTLWEDHFSYLDVKDITQSSVKIYVATDNAIFVYDTNTNQLETITTVDGLSGQIISNIHYSETYDRLLIGYANGLIEIVSGDNEVLTVVDILDKQTIPPNLKRINHFNEDNGLVYISTNYGISVYDLERLEFGDTYFIGFGGTQIAVNQTTVIDNFIYAACGNNSAIKKASKSNPNLIDFAQWQTINSGNFSAIENVNNNLYAVKNNILYSITNDVLSALFTYPLAPVDVRGVGDYLIVTISNRVYVYDSGFNLIVSPTITTEFATQFSSAIVNAQEEVFIGTRNILATGKPGYGMLKTTFADVSMYQEIHPDGPFLNNIFSIQTPPNEIWAVFGGYSNTFSLAGAIQRSGVSRYNNQQWINIPYDSIASTITNPFHLSHIAVNPFNTNQVYISSYYSGLIEINNNEVVGIFNQDNSTILPFSGQLHLTHSSSYDRTGTLWVMNGRTESPLNKFQDNQWNSFSFSSIINNAANDELGFRDITIDNNGTVWIASNNNGVIAFNENESQIVRINSEEQNMPDNRVKALALDNNNQLWIGTIRGIRVLFNTSNVFNGIPPVVNEIVILEDGIPQELLSNQVITDIEVDGSNNKWVATGTSGVFYFSPDGQNTIYHFTTDNSPLPSNFINDISIDTQTGRVYIATIRGLVSFNSGGSKTEEELDNAFVYPNPVRPEYNLLGTTDLNDITKGVKIKGLTEKVNIKITDIEGNLVAEAQSGVNLRASSSRYNFAIDGGTAIWNGKNLGNNVVASGVYLIMISDLDTFETKVLKLLIIR